jgi:hypothetical protein
MHRRTDTDNLAELIRRHIGWQVDDVEVRLVVGGLSLRGHAYTRLARALVEVEAARLSGLPVMDNQIEVAESAARRRAAKPPAAGPTRSARSCGKASAD